MRIERVVTKQGHPVPKSAHSPKGPFPSELFVEPKVITDYESFDTEIPRGATAQNNFKSPRMFRCSYCTVVVLEHEMPNHTCSGAPDGENS